MFRKLCSVIRKLFCQHIGDLPKLRHRSNPITSFLENYKRTHGFKYSLIELKKMQCNISLNAIHLEYKLIKAIFDYLNNLIIEIPRVE